MRRSMRILLTGLVVGATAACAGGTPEAPETTTPTISEPDETQPVETSEPEPEPSAEVPDDVTEDVLLPAEALGTADEPREVDDAVGPWQLPQACEPVTPDASAMLTLTQGTGEFEMAVGLHQVAVFPDADAAVEAADALVAELTRCAEAGADGGILVLEEIPVGAQGHGLAIDYYGASADGDLDTAIGRYLALTRRGAAVTLTGTLGGEANVAAAREEVVGWAQQAWELLCAHDVDGC
ncbi:hypothetical protein GXB85_11405 [Cellulomonas sp. APG4]|uniref:hypothetical protein n=1 Tax=Cellulomonas sp. APG4 TaxID=1538656 RepID=UPI001379C11C|nr:hypothetical protein [Cellulomonas sp. APG4]NCT91554.1 hypothetical protein [Cellulomonas sp. APG4]